MLSNIKVNILYIFAAVQPEQDRIMSGHRRRRRSSPTAVGVGEQNSTSNSQQNPSQNPLVMRSRRASFPVGNGERVHPISVIVNPQRK